MHAASRRKGGRARRAGVIDRDARQATPVAAGFGPPGAGVVRRPVGARGVRSGVGQRRGTEIRNRVAAVDGAPAAGIGPEFEIPSVRADDQEIQIIGKSVLQRGQADTDLGDSEPCGRRDTDRARNRRVVQNRKRAGAVADKKRAGWHEDISC